MAKLGDLKERALRVVVVCGCTRIVNIRDTDEWDIYIGHQAPPSMSPTGKYLPKSIWANPFNKEFRRGEITREEAIAKYREYVLASPSLMARLPELWGKTLGCWCAPLPCHGDVLVELLA